MDKQILNILYLNIDILDRVDFISGLKNSFKSKKLSLILTWLAATSFNY